MDLFKATFIDKRATNFALIDHRGSLAIKFQDMVGRGEVRDYADLARLGYVTRARMTQLMNLLNLAPDIQEDILFLPGVPQVYYAGLLAGRNDAEAARHTGDGREINRHNYGTGEVTENLGRDVVQRLMRLMRILGTTEEQMRARHTKLE